MEESKTANKVDSPCPSGRQADDNLLLESDIISWANWATTKNYNIAIYRKPGKSPRLIIDTGFLKKVSSPIEDLKPGFLFANYKGEMWHMEAIHSINFNSNEEISSPFDASNHNKDWDYYTTNEEQSTTSKREYISAVKQGIDTIKATELIKVVPTKIKLHKLSKDFSLAKAYLTLCNKHPSAFVSIVSTNEFGTWLTATPELLIDVDEKGIFETMALAGTQKFDAKKSMHEVAWVDKDIEEQAMVSRYIINRFKEIRLREFTEKGPMTVRAANLTHLCTTFKVDTKATSFPNLGGVMLDLLHPTSAVCGMPKEKALELINLFERHDRKFYTGYLGPVNINNKTSLFVNLRCLELFKENANLFAGAGVTEISDPEKEWDETELKFNTLLNIIG